MASELHKYRRYIILSSYTFLIPSVVFLLGIIYFASNSFSISDFPLDDAWIHRVYSRSFAFGHGFQYNEGIQEAGSTSPLWTILSSPAHWLEPFGTKAVVITVKLIGILLSLISIRVIQELGKNISGSSTVGIVAASLFALEPRFLFSALSGMETPLLLSLWLCASYTFILRKWLLSAFLFSLMPVTRPEALVILPLYIIGLLINVDHKKRNFKQIIIWIIPWLPMLLWICFCKFTNDHLLPNTFYLKAQSFHLGTHEFKIAWQSLTQHGLSPLYIFITVLIAYFVWSVIIDTFITKSILLFLIVTPLVYLIGVVGTRIVKLEGYYWTRWIDPASLILTVPFCFGYAIIILSFIYQTGFIPNRFNIKTYYRILAFLITGLGLIGLLYSIPSFYNSFINRRDHIASDSRAIHMINVRPGKWIYENTPIDVTIGVSDAGAIRYFGKRKTIDLIGINNKDIAFKKVSYPQIFREIDWLAVFPSMLQKSNIFNYFEPRISFHIPLEEYTICNCPEQTTKVVFEKKSLKN